MSSSAATAVLPPHFTQRSESILFSWSHFGQSIKPADDDRR